MNTQEQHHNKLDEILSKIPNGKEKYQKTPLVRMVVDSILHGADSIVVIANLIDMVESVTKQNIDLTIRLNPRSTMIVDELTQINYRVAEQLHTRIFGPELEEGLPLPVCKIKTS